jgi:hypothetical protein
LGADPIAPVFSAEMPWTPLHLATKYHLPEILRLLILWAEKDLEYLIFPELPLACALSFSTAIERFAMHASKYGQCLAETAEAIPLRAFEMVSVEGWTALMQAIDFSDCSVATVILGRLPTLAARGFVDPEDESSFVYPLHLASQIAARRDAEDAAEIVELWKNTVRVLGVEIAWAEPLCILPLQARLIE